MLSQNLYGEFSPSPHKISMANNQVLFVVWKQVITYKGKVVMTS